jgi:hypothetical protein
MAGFEPFAGSLLYLSQEGSLARGRPRFYELVEGHPRKGLCFTRRLSSRRALLTEGSLTERGRRRAKARSGLGGQTVIGDSSVSALGRSPIRQREVLLARVPSPLRATSADWKGCGTGRRRRRETPSGEDLSRSSSTIRGMPSQFFLREEGLQRGLDEVDGG